MASEDANSFIQRYQSLYNKDPRGKIFAPLAEAYRRNGFVERALKIAEQGVKLHPNFSSGRVALARCYIEKEDIEKAIENLKIATDLSPDNLLAHQLLSECFLKVGKKSEALNALKMVLFLNPNDAKTAHLVSGLEKEVFGTETETEPEEEYAMKPLAEAQKTLTGKTKSTTDSISVTSLERDLILFDTWFDRGDWQRAEEILNRLPSSVSKNPQVQERRVKLQELTRTGLETIDTEWISPFGQNEKSQKIQHLEDLLSRIDSRRR